MLSSFPPRSKHYLAVGDAGDMFFHRCGRCRRHCYCVALIDAVLATIAAKISLIVFSQQATWFALVPVPKVIVVSYPEVNNIYLIGVVVTARDRCCYRVFLAVSSTSILFRPTLIYPVPYPMLPLPKILSMSYCFQIAEAITMPINQAYSCLLL